MSKDKLKIDSVMPLDQVISKLEELASSLKNGSMTIQLGQESMQLRPSGVVDFEMKVSRKKDKEKVSLEISWEVEQSQAMQISAEAPGIKLG